MLVAVLVLGATAWLVGEGVGSSDPLDGRPRRPDLSGVVAEVRDGDLVLETGEHLALAKAPVVSSYTREPIALRPGMFVHVGLAETTPRWVTVLGIVTRAQPPYLTYTATITEVSADELVFADGTVLDHRGLEAYPGYAIVTVDPRTDRAVRIRQDLLTGTSGKAASG